MRLFLCFDRLFINIFFYCSKFYDSNCKLGVHPLKSDVDIIGDINFIQQIWHNFMLFALTLVSNIIYTIMPFNFFKLFFFFLEIFLSSGICICLMSVIGLFWYFAQYSYSQVLHIWKILSQLSNFLNTI